MSTAARKDGEKQHRRDTILAAAAGLFFARGYRATMEEIAAQAGISKGTLYLYFASKDELYISVIMEGFRILEERMQAALEGVRGAEERAKAAYFAFIDHCLENRQYFRITQYFLTEDARKNTSDDLVEAINGYTAKLLERGARALREGVESGAFKEDTNPNAVALISWRTATGILDLAVLEDDLGEGLGTYRELFETAIETILGGIKK